MLPIMSFTLVGYLGFYFNYYRKLQNVISQIWLDKSGNEIRVVFNNRFYRNLRQKQTEDILLNSSLISPNKETFPKKDSI